MNPYFKDKVAFVTGAANGIGRAAALAFAREGANVVVADVSEQREETTPMMQRFTGGTEEGRAKVIGEEPIGRMGKPEEIAATVVWLCSEAAGFVIGHAMVVDGGQTIQ